MRPLLGMFLILLFLVSAVKSFGVVLTSFVVYGLAFSLKTWEEMQ